MIADQAEQVDFRTLVVLAFSATAGVLVEFYDFFIFGFAAAVAFPAIFFPNLSPSSALVFSYLTFGAGFPSRLLGAFIFGHFGDRAGRKFAFLINIAIVGAGTCLAGLLPGYATLGIAAPLLLVLLRVVQGIGIGGEFGGAAALLAEFGAKRKSRAFWMSLASLGIPLGGMAASSVMLLMSKSFATTGWRVAMLLSAVIVVPALVARYKLADSPLFERLKQREQLAERPSFAVFKRHSRAIFLLAFGIAFCHMDGYLGGTYIISFMRFAGIPLATVALITLLSRIGDILGIVFSGPLADLLKRRKTYYFAIGIATILSYPLVRAMLAKNILLVIVLHFLITVFGLGLTQGLAPILISESFPTKYRYSGSGISYSLSAILGGMIAPALVAGLIGRDVAHKWYYVNIVYIIYCVVAMLAVSFIPETRDVQLEDLDQTGESSPAAAKIVSKQ